MASSSTIGVIIRQMENDKIRHYAAAQLEVRPFILSGACVAGGSAKDILRDVALAHLEANENRIGKTAAFVSRLNSRISISLIRFACDNFLTQKSHAYYGP